MPSTAAPMKAAVASTAELEPSTASRNTATTGYERFANWFHRLTSVTPRPMSLPRKPQRRRIPYAPAIPTAAPPGTTNDSAVET